MKQHNIFGGIDNIDSTGEIIKEKTTMKNTKELTKLALISGVYLDFVSHLNANNLWSKRVKNMGNNLAEEIAKFDNFAMKGIDIKTSEDFMGGYQSICNLIDFNLTLNNDQLEDFDKELNELINKYK